MTGWLPSAPPPQLFKLLWLSHKLLSAHTGKIFPPPWLHPRVAPPGSHTDLSSSHSAKPLTTTTLATSPCWYSALEFIKYPSEDGEWLIEILSNICAEVASGTGNWNSGTQLWWWSCACLKRALSTLPAWQPPMCSPWRV